jgi:hypothetical protein
MRFFHIEIVCKIEFCKHCFATSKKSKMKDTASTKINTKIEGNQKNRETQPQKIKKRKTASKKQKGKK